MILCNSCVNKTAAKMECVKFEVEQNVYIALLNLTF